ncbi:hypothetical protein FCN13_00200 [Pseudomonas sp. UMC631]|nr:hypothetical protein [Pseudomonas sp. UMA643]NTY21753.1 hypothetical protein [Pseudomonas sp. UMC3103]NTY26131.1 hypothetical protein [Pseudomonas sp. UMA603]NTY28869.1 hypothetical protein [Pseudomonas sp. UMC3129]NTY52012.1 hypothetical protein [Pseudomonas sp. UMC631]NTY64094.1 hypothetical protein [Pseudomonas sp. UMC3106]NUA36052.1 hypothetical protein [Pseudomonas sp. UMA601]
MRKLLVTDRLVAVREGAGCKRGKIDLAPGCPVSPSDGTARPGQMSDCFFDFLATATHAQAGAKEPGSGSEWSELANMGSPLRESGTEYAQRRTWLSTFS